MFLLVLMAAAGLAACQPERLPEDIPLQSFLLQPGGKVVVQVGAGQVKVRGVEGEQVIVGGEILLPGRVTFHAALEGQQVSIQSDWKQRSFLQNAQPPIALEIGLPRGALLEVSTFDASVNLSEIGGEIYVDSVAGHILAEKLEGSARLRSGRGDIRAVGFSGRLVVLGEHGLLVIEDSKGEAGASTIMGTIQYIGWPGAGDKIRLETDHGPVRVDLKLDPSLAVSARSASGNVVCLLPGLRSTTRTCEGTMGAGEGALNVYTVSGEIRLRISP
jgi:hypothetical protein